LILALWLLAVFGCALGWVAVYSVSRQASPTMVKNFLASKFGRSCVALLAGALAPAVPQLVMGDVHAFRVALGSAAGALVALIALHAKSDGAS
jgi:hypothetical protein